MPDLGDKMNICLISEEEEGKEGEWYTLGDLEKVKKNFAHFAPVVREMLELAGPEDCYIWRLSEMPPLERWVSGSGKAVIVGDAGHAMLPYANQVCSLEFSMSVLLRSTRGLPNVSRTLQVLRCVSKEQKL
jgi:salicylate hydroxylase